MPKLLELAKLHFLEIKYASFTFNFFVIICGFYLKNPYNDVFLMSIWRVILSILFPPLAVIDKGCGSILIVLILTICGWVPGVIAALVILNNPKK